MAAEMAGRKSYGFEIKKEFCQAFEEKFNKEIPMTIDQILQKNQVSLLREKHEEKQRKAI